MSRRPAAKPLLALLGLCLCLAPGCATSPIGVRRMDPQDVQRQLTRSVLTEDEPSIPTMNVLYRRGLYVPFQKNPAWTLAELHRIALAENDDDTYFALAELSFLHANRTHDRRYAIMAALYAWAWLFESDQPPEPFDPRLRVAADLYNRGLTQGMEPDTRHGMEIAGGSYQLPIGQLNLAFDASVLDWNGRRLRDFVPVAELEVEGLENRFRTPGIGAPLAASAATATGDPTGDFLAPKLKTPVTALVRVEGVRRQFATGAIEATLELHTDPNEEFVTVEGRQVPLEKEPTAALAAMVAEAPVIRQELEAFLGLVTQQADKGVLAALRPHVKGRIPVVFVHGTASSPARWAEMVNVLDNDPRVNERYEPWFFAYNSSSPIIYSAYLLRSKLIEAVNRLDPDGTDTELRRMVVIGHSQGGLLTKMTAVHSGDALWRNISSKPIDQVRLDDADRALLKSVMFVEPLPFVRRVVFICTPHRGSFLAAHDWVRSIITRLVSLPARVTRISASILTLNPDLATMQGLKSPNAVDNMSPTNRFVHTLSEIPVDPSVTANSIIAVLGEGPLDTLNDGVVEYKSAHIDGVESEKVVHSGHSTQAVPETIEEVRRILLLHAGEAAPSVQPAAAPAAAKARPKAAARTKPKAPAPPKSPPAAAPVAAPAAPGPG